VRLRLFALGAGLVVALAGCDGDGDGDGDRAVPAAALVAQAPAASAGGACVLWSYRFIEQRIGVHFDVAASGRVDDTTTCAVQVQGADRPDLTLAVVERTPADPAVFLSDQMPAKSVQVKGLGRAAYRLVSAAGGDHGPVVEVGWLSRDKQLITIRFTFAPGASDAAAKAMVDGMLDLAKALDAPIS
jgi:hypothetical protein